MHNKKDTSWYVIPPDANKCSATKSTTQNTSPGSYLLNSRTIISSKTTPNPPKKQRKSKKIHRSGHNSNNSPYSIRQQNSCLIFVLLSFPFYLFPSSFYPFLFFPPLSTSSLYLFLKINLYQNQQKDTSYHLTPL